jgi:hypothetical protein
MNKIRYYQILDGVKLCIDSSISVLQLPEPEEGKEEHFINAKNARNTIRLANLKLREVMTQNWEEDGEEI